ncbi:unnamed protein product [Linum trigynum]|uniref:Uncharacterized protein n=1 Tax=Linum trigynum TaxID=586398 RepID=A0AAV2DA01_9ROSI
MAASLPLSTLPSLSFSLVSASSEMRRRRRNSSSETLANTTKAKPTFLSLILETTRIKTKRHTAATVTIGHVAVTVTIGRTPPAKKTTTTRREIEGFRFGLVLWEFKKGVAVESGSRGRQQR